MSMTGPVGGPPSKFGIPIADIAAGMFSAYAVSSALYVREKSGVGQWIDASMLGGQVASGPITYRVDGKQYIAVAAGHALFTFALRQ